MTCHFSLSGMQNKAAAHWRRKGKENAARFVLECLIYAISGGNGCRLGRGLDPVACGVYRRRILKFICCVRQCEPEGGISRTVRLVATDNAMGIAVLTWLSENGHAE